MLTILLIVLIVLLLSGGGTYNRWGSTGPAWGGNALYLVAGVLAVLFIISFFGGMRP